MCSVCSCGLCGRKWQLFIRSLMCVARITYFFLNINIPAFYLMFLWPVYSYPARMHAEIIKSHKIVAQCNVYKVGGFCIATLTLSLLHIV